MLVYFGSAFCPDACPATLHEVAEEIGKLMSWLIQSGALYARSSFGQRCAGIGHSSVDGGLAKAAARRSSPPEKSPHVLTTGQLMHRTAQ
jgi:hypothetical protein